MPVNSIFRDVIFKGIYFTRSFFFLSLFFLFSSSMSGNQQTSCVLMKASYLFYFHI